jgi:hypothetical protein
MCTTGDSLTMPSRALAFASLWFDASIVHGTFEPLIADWQREWLEAASKGRRRLITMRWVVAFGAAVLESSPRALLFSPTPAGTTPRAIARIIIFTGIASLLMTLPFVAQMRSAPADKFAWLVLSLLPSNIAVALPFAMTWGASPGRRTLRLIP